MMVAVPTETRPREQRVAMVPSEVSKLVGAGVAVTVQSGAGRQAGYRDEDYEEAGAAIAPDAAQALAAADVVTKVLAPTVDEAAMLPKGSALVSFLTPTADLETVRVLADRKVSAFSFDLVPRISRAQGMDALSSQASVAGYRAVLVAAVTISRFFPMVMTAAGTVPPARVLVMGAGVAGLQAIATARRLGGVVQAYDVRPEAAEEVRSLGATFLDLGLEAA
ncbi:MAG: NAD(P)(+) transhydrogenase (Re/Si-specific) subunit alpha, partial [Acidimicrobiaceae bacterium]|nr:NAD(P)(+) transhydrogenase (Re/Si-specific) subunit alpha [Acidimicrobiaceae bacterium]